MPETPISRRLALVIKENFKSTRAFARVAEVDESYIRKMVKGENDLNYAVIKAVCLKLGYSPTWLLFGTGNKKYKGNEAKLVTEISMLRTEIDIAIKLNMRLQARLTGVEGEYKELKEEVAQLKSAIRK